MSTIPFLLIDLHALISRIEVHLEFVHAADTFLVTLHQVHRPLSAPGFQNKYFYYLVGVDKSFKCKRIFYQIQNNQG